MRPAGSHSEAFTRVTGVDPVTDIPGRIEQAIAIYHAGVEPLPCWFGNIAGAFVTEYGAGTSQRRRAAALRVMFTFSGTLRAGAFLPPVLT